MIYHYDQVYSYELILKEVKELLLPTVLNSVNSKDAEEFGLRKQDLAEMIYSQIMALGYNNQDINDSVNDLMSTRNPFIYQVRAFQTFHKMTQELKPYDEVIRNIKLQILPLL